MWAFPGAARTDFSSQIVERQVDGCVVYRHGFLVVNSIETFYWCITVVAVFVTSWSGLRHLLAFVVYVVSLFTGITSAEHWRLCFGVGRFLSAGLLENVNTFWRKFVEVLIMTQEGSVEMQLLSWIFMQDSLSLGDSSCIESFVFARWQRYSRRIASSL